MPPREEGRGVRRVPRLGQRRRHQPRRPPHGRGGGQSLPRYRRLRARVRGPRRAGRLGARHWPAALVRARPVRCGALRRLHARRHGRRLGELRRVPDPRGHHGGRGGSGSRPGRRRSPSSTEAGAWPSPRGAGSERSSPSTPARSSSAWRASGIITSAGATGTSPTSPASSPTAPSSPSPMPTSSSNCPISWASRPGLRIVRIWDGRGRLLYRLTAHQDKVQGLDYRPDGRRLVTTDESGAIHLWQTTIDKRSADGRSYAASDRAYDSVCAGRGPDGRRRSARRGSTTARSGSTTSPAAGSR